MYIGRYILYISQAAARHLAIVCAGGGNGRGLEYRQGEQRAENRSVAVAAAVGASTEIIYLSLYVGERGWRWVRGRASRAISRRRGRRHRPAAF